VLWLLDLVSLVEDQEPQQQVLNRTYYSVTCLGREAEAGLICPDQDCPLQGSGGKDG